MARKQDQEQQIIDMLKIVRDVRKRHPEMGVRVIYDKVQPAFIGRDKFEKLCFENGFRIKHTPNFRKTTNSWGVTRFDNLIQDIELNRLNQVWVSDITYYEIDGSYYYITLIMDLFTREIIGYQVSKKLKTEHTTLPALKMAIKARKPFGINQTIFHSDGGGQYYDKGFRAELLNSGIISSMAENVYENPHAERINRTVKSNYIKHYDPSNYQELCQCLKKAVDMYNNDRPHQSLNRLTPKAFRQLHELNPQNQCLSTKEKRSKKEKIIITSNNIVKPSKVVNTN